MPSLKKRTTKKYHIDTDVIDSFEQISKAARKNILKQRNEFKSKSIEELNFRHDLRNATTSRQAISIQPKTDEEAQLRLKGVIRQIQLCEELKQELLRFLRNVDTIEKNQMLEEYKLHSKKSLLNEREKFLINLENHNKEMNNLYKNALLIRTSQAHKSMNDDAKSIIFQDTEPAENNLVKEMINLNSEGEEFLSGRPLYDQIKKMSQKNTQTISQPSE